MALRTPLSVTPHLYMGDSTGRPLDMGTVYFGEQDKDPEFYPITLYSDDALTLPLAQPVHTKGGYLYDKGDMVEPHAKELIYSVKVLDSYGRKVFYKGAMMRNSWNDDVIEQINAAIVASTDIARQIATDITNDAINNTAVEGGVLADTFVTSTVNGVGAVARTQRDVNSDTVNVRDFGAKGDGVTDDTLSFKNALAHLYDIGGGTLKIGRGRYIISETIDMGEYVKQYATTNPYPAIEHSIDLEGDGTFNTVLIWKGGLDSNGGYGTALLLRGNIRADGNREKYYYGSVSNFSIEAYDLKTKARQKFPYAATNRFTTRVSTVAGCAPIATSLDDYPREATNDPMINNMASCAINIEGITPARIHNVHVAGFAIGFSFGSGYGTSIDSISARWCCVGARFGKAITTTYPVNSVFEKCGVGVLLNVSSSIGFEKCVMQGNYAGCDVLFHSWNRRIKLHKCYFEVSPKNIVIRTDSSGDFRNSDVIISECTGVELDVDVSAISTLLLDNNLMYTSVFNTTGTGATRPDVDYKVTVRDNYIYPTGTKATTLYTNWGLDRKHLVIKDTVGVSNLLIARSESLTSVGFLDEINTITLNSENTCTLEIPNQEHVSAILIEGVATRNAANIKDVLYFRGQVAVMRKVDELAKTIVNTEYGKNFEGYADGLGMTTAPVYVATVTGEVDGNNLITFKASQAALGGSGAINTINIKLMIVKGDGVLKKI